VNSLTAAAPEKLETLRAMGREAVRRLDRRPFPVVTHARMLAEQSRLAAYRAAIDALVSEVSEVVDIGTGTGILASYAAARTRGTVHAIEVDTSALALARMLFDRAGLSNVRTILGTSFGRPLAAQPEVLVTETLGPLGVEEYVVESCFEFCSCYPSVKTLIPHTLRVCAQPVKAPSLVAWGDGVIGDLLGASWGDFQYQAIEPELRRALTEAIVELPIRDAVPVGGPQVLASFALGRSRGSAFSAEIEVSSACDALHLFFEADLGAGQSISTGSLQAATHWGQHFAIRPPGADRLLLDYHPRTQSYQLAWRCPQPGGGDR
jgi:hypothetical protein